MTEIGMVAGEILELLDQRKGVMVFGHLKPVLNRPRDLILMSLGWLFCKGYLHLMEDPQTSKYKQEHDETPYAQEPSLFDVILLNNPPAGRTKGIRGRISVVAGEILQFMHDRGDLLDIQTVEENIPEHRDIVLMSLGWLIREGYVCGIRGSNEIFIYQLHKKTADTELKDSCLV